MRYFIFITHPDMPLSIHAIFNSKKNAMEYYNKHWFGGQGYFKIRKAEWSDGRLPDFSETEEIKRKPTPCLKKS
jgi:hypothetical protein